MAADSTPHGVDALIRSASLSIPSDELMASPVCIDLFCGLGGWAEGFLMEGYRVVGFDIDPRFIGVYPGELILADVRTLNGRRFRNARCIVASPPCNEFSDLRFLRSNPPPPDMSLVDAAFRIRKESGLPTVIENVRGARRFFPEPVVAWRGPWYLWGDVPILFDGKLDPKIGAVARARVAGHPHRGWNGYPGGRSKLLGPARLKKWGARDRSKGGAAERAKIPLPLARAIARGFL